MTTTPILKNKLTKLSSSSIYNFFSTFSNSVIYNYECHNKALGLNYEKMKTNWLKMSTRRILPIQDRVIHNALCESISNIYMNDEDNSMADFVRDNYLNPKLRE